MLKLAGEINFSGDARQGFQHEFSRNTGMAAGAGSRYANPVQRLQLIQAPGNPLNQTPAAGIFFLGGLGDGQRLLINFLEHVVLKMLCLAHKSLVPVSPK